MELLERDAQLEALDRLLREAAAGQGRAVFLGGEAGAGKTALIGRFLAGPAVRADVLLGACDALSTPRPLGPLFDMARGLGGELEASLRTGDARFETFRRFLARLGSAARPTVAVFEDVHWADEATLDLLRFTVRRVADRRCLLIASYRDDETGPQHPLRRLLGDLATAAALRRLGLPRLSEAAVAQLAEGSGVDAGHLYRITGGNAFFVTEVLAAGAGEVPVSVRDAVLARVSRLDGAARSALEACAVLGATVDAATLEAVEGGAVAAADACVTNGVLRAEADTFAFRHELARDALLAAMPPQRRRELHGRAFEAIGRLHRDDLRRLAHHAEGAGDGAAVLACAPGAGDQAAALGAHREAAAQYARALRFASDLPAPDRAELLERLAWARQLTDRMDDAIAAWTEAVDLWRATGQPLRAGAGLARAAHALVLAGRNAEAERASRTAIDVLEAQPPSRELGLAYRYQSYLRMLDRDTADAIAWGERALALATRFDDRETLAHAQNAIGSALIVAGSIDPGRAALERSAELARAAGEVFHVANAYSNLGSGLGEVVEVALAERYLGLALAHDAEHDLDADAAYARAWLALVCVYRGRWDEAADHAAEVLRRPGTATISRIMALVALGRVRARRGDPQVWETLDEALRLAAPTGTLQRLGPVHATRAEAAWLEGDTAKAGAEARAAFGLAERKGHAWLVGELGYWRWKVGDVAEPPAGAADPFARQIRGDAEGAAAAWSKRGCPYEAARAWADAGDEASLRRALATFEALGARPAATDAARCLRGLGVKRVPRGPRPSTRANAAGLTPRQLDVLRLVAEGRTNHEIARELGRSPRTVEHHVAAILAKLEATNRTEAARAATRLGLLNDERPG